MEGVVASTSVDAHPLMNDQEIRLLELYDRLEELQFEIALLRAQGVLSKDQPEDVSEEAIQTAQAELLEARANYTLRSKIVDNVLVANPILNAVHAGSNASAIEQDLLPLIQQRETVSETLAGLSSKAQAAKEELAKVESEHIITARKNLELSVTMLSLAEQAKTQRIEDIDDPKLRAELDELEASLKMSRQRWRIMKDTASAVIVGSGIDWARDEDLLKIVLDKDGEDEDEDR